MRNGHPYRYVDVDRDADVQTLLDEFHVDVDDIPILICRDERVLRNPSDAEVADCLGFNAALEPERRARRRDLRRRARRARRGGLRRFGGARRARRRGGRAGRAGRFELEDRELPRLPHRHLRPGAGGARAHAGREVRRRARGRAGCAAPSLRRGPDPHRARRRRIGARARGRHRDRGRVPQARRARTSRNSRASGVYYAATFVEAQRCAADEVIVVGGGNSAGQAATFLARTAKHVHMLIRGAGPRVEHVALPHSPHRRDAEHHAAPPHADRRAPRKRAPRERHVARRDDRRRDDTRHPPRLLDGRREPEHRLATRVRRDGRQGLRADRA